MKFKVSSNLLHSHLQLVSRVIVQKNTVPILECALFEFAGNQLTITASDGDTRLITRLLVEEHSGENLSFAIRSKQLLDPLKEISDQIISLEINEEEMSVNVFYKNGNFSFKAVSGDGYPPIQEVQDEPVALSMPIKTFMSGLNYTFYATSNDDVRPIMTGVHFDITPTDITFVGTDGFLLATYNNSEYQSGATCAFTFQKKPAVLLRNILSKDDEGDIDLRIFSNRAEVKCDQIEMVCRLIEGKYPNYKAVMPANNENVLIADRLQLLMALRRVSMFSNQAINLVSLEITADKLLLKANDIDFSTAASEEVPISYTGNPQTISFRSTHLMDVLSNMCSDNISFKLGDKTLPGLLSPFEHEKNEELVALVMPLTK